MDVLKTSSEIRLFLKRQNISFGLVPTMGALHQGHLSLITQSKQECSQTICSIFVNPIQFTNQQDFEKYPATLEQDLKLLAEAGCDAVFVPQAKDMYQRLPQIKFNFGLLESVMEGASRPGHFNGVAIVVSKLFHLVQPTHAYFGQKDLQQTLIIKQLVEDLSFPIRLITGPTLREADGLAMSSRNVRLTPEHRQLAPVLYKTLTEAKAAILIGEPFEKVIQRLKEKLNASGNIKTDYFEIADSATLQTVNESFEGEIALCIAAYLGEVRLIDNLVFSK